MFAITNRKQITIDSPTVFQLLRGKYIRPMIETHISNRLCYNSTMLQSDKIIVLGYAKLDECILDEYVDV